MTMKTTVLVLAYLGLGVLSAQAQSRPAEDIAAEAFKCQACHGAGGGNSVPRLNGQRADYILTRLREFHDPASQAPHATYVMWEMASSVGAKKAEALATFFSRQAPTPSHGSGALAEKGKKLYQSGDGAVQACQACHGAQGEGQGAIPRLAGQHNRYLSQQLANFGMKVRFHKTMGSPARWLRSDQI
jgi:cytochrome c553